MSSPAVPSMAAPRESPAGWQSLAPISLAFARRGWAAYLEARRSDGHLAAAEGASWTAIDRASAAIAVAGTRCSNLLAAPSRTCSRRLRPSAVSLPPCAYRMHAAYRQNPHPSSLRTSPIKLKVFSLAVCQRGAGGWGVRGARACPRPCCRVRRRLAGRRVEGATRVILDEIRAMGPQLAELCRKYGIAELSVFGSVARGDAQPGSDVDLLYVRVPGNDLGMSYFALQEDLEKLFGRPVDLVPKEGLHRVIRDQVLSDAQVLYAA